MGADTINIHGGGAYGDKGTALKRLWQNLKRLPERVRARITLENHDRIFSLSDLLPLCRAAGIPFVYDVHHHRCCPDSMSSDEATEAALETWPREPLFHLSSPLGGWHGPDPRRHADYIRFRDVPKIWLDLNFRWTIELEAKTKELAVARFQRDLTRAMSSGRPARR